MAFKRIKSSAPSQDFASSDVRSGNNKHGVGVTAMNWPKQGFTVDNEVSPQVNVFPPEPLSKTQQAFRDSNATVPRNTKYKSTLG